LCPNDTAHGTQVRKGSFQSSGEFRMSREMIRPRGMTTRMLEHALQKMSPHARQWCRRLTTENLA